MNTERFYSVYLAWSNEDGAYIAMIPELPGCMADGQTHEEALRNLTVVAEEWIQTAKEESRPVPEPRRFEDLGRIQGEFNKAVRKHIAKEVMATVNRILDQLSRQQTAQFFVSFDSVAEDRHVTARFGDPVACR